MGKSGNGSKKRRPNQNHQTIRKKRTTGDNRDNRAVTVTTQTQIVSNGNIRGNCAKCKKASNTFKVNVPTGGGMMRAAEEASVDGGSEGYPTSIITASPSVADGVANGEANGGDSVSTLPNDALAEENNRLLLMNEYLEEQAALGNRATGEDIVKKVGDFTRNDVFRKIKFLNDKDKIDSTRKKPMYVLSEFVKKKYADSDEVTAQRRDAWWSQYSKPVCEALGRKRAEVMGAIKKDLIGT
jgi:hypothetical protein